MSNQARVYFQRDGQPLRSKRIIPAPLARVVKASVDEARLVVVEEGVQHFDSQLPRDDSEHTVVVAQIVGESYPVLVERVRKARASLSRAGKQVGSAILVLNSRHDADSFRTRLSLGKAMVAPSVLDRTTPSSELMIIAIDCAQELRLELMSIVETLVGELGSGQPPLKLRFPKSASAESARGSGVFLRPFGIASERR